VPAALIELGYLSNAHDSAQMETADWRDATAQAIAVAIERNFGAIAQPVPVAAKTVE